MNALKCSCWVWLLGCLTVGSVADAHTQAPDAAAPPTQIRVVADGNYPPYLYLDTRGQPQGYEADVWRLFEAHTGIKVKLEPMGWTAANRAMLSGQADVIDMIYRTPSNQALYDFSTPYATNSIAIYVNHKMGAVRDLAALRGVPIGVQRDGACAVYLQTEGVANVVAYPDYQSVLTAAAQGKLRAFCMGEQPANFLLYDFSIRNHFDEAFVLFEQQLYRAVHKHDAAMLQIVDRGMEQITPAEYATLRKRWLSQPKPPEGFLRVAGIVAAIVLALVALMALWVGSLRRRVTARTRELQAKEAKLRAMFDASPDAMTFKNREGIYVDCNEGALKHFGRTREQLLGHSIQEVAGADAGGKMQALDDAVLREGKPRTLLTSFKLDDGQTHEYEIIKLPLRSPDGALDGILTVARDVSERVQANAKLRLWADAFQHAGSGVAIFNAKTRCLTAANPTFARERGYTPEEMIGMHVDKLYPADLVAEREQARRVMDTQVHAVVETEQTTRDGRRFPVRLDLTVTHDADGAATDVIVFAQDITARRQAESELRLAAATFQTQEALMVLDPNRRILRVNQAFSRITGYAPHELLGKPSAMLIVKQDDPAFYKAKWKQVEESGSWQGEQWIQVKHGQPKAARITLSAVADASGETSHFVCSVVDLTREREAHASVDHMTFFDPLTDLPNRYFLHGRLQHLLDQSADTPAGALLIIDIDHFKRINDLRGHAAGDQLLAAIAKRLRDALDAHSILCRFSGGTFALLEEGRPREQGLQAELQARASSERVREALRAPFKLGDEAPTTITVSIGWTRLSPGHGTPDAVLKEAELAMYSAKAAGRDQMHQFVPAMQEDLLRREALGQDLRTAIADEALEFHLQPQSDRAGRITGAEILLRWTRPGGEKVSPAVFIPIAEESGLILTLGSWVLERACMLLAAWSERPATRHLVLAVNVSAKQFDQPGFVESVRRVLATTRANPELLKLEITESAILGDLDEISSKLARLRAHGIRISLDDFGTGYSSLSYLSRLPLDQLKIDQSFVARLPRDANDAMVAQTILAMGRGLGMEVVAEGVETEAQRDFLMARGCDAFQGYLIARPMPAEAFEALLDRQTTSA